MWTWVLSYLRELTLKDGRPMLDRTPAEQLWTE